MLTKEIPEGLEYPLITKAAISTIGAWKKDVFICNNQEELEEAYKHIRSSRVMLQKYIHKKMSWFWKLSVLIKE